MYLYLKALHIIFIVTWFAGLFYMPRLMIYTVEAAGNDKNANQNLISQLLLMQKRLWLGITWPSAIMTLILGPWVMWQGGWLQDFATQHWLHIKLIFVLGLYGYHLYTHYLYKQQQRGVYKLSSMQLRIWNEVSTLFLVAIVFLAVVKDSLAWMKAIVGLIVLIVVLLGAIRIYKKVRKG